jgi:hypothetical protein
MYDICSQTCMISFVDMAVSKYLCVCQLCLHSLYDFDISRTVNTKLTYSGLTRIANKQTAYECSYNTFVNKLNMYCKDRDVTFPEFQRSMLYSLIYYVILLIHLIALRHDYGLPLLLYHVTIRQPASVVHWIM